MDEKREHKQGWEKLIFDGVPIKEVTFDIVYNPMETANASVTLPDDHPYDMDVVFEYGRLITIVVGDNDKTTGRVVGVEGNTAYLYVD